MDPINARDERAVISRLHRQAETDALRVTTHAHQEMVEEGISIDDLIEVLLDGMLVENYPEHKRGPCALVCGRTALGRYIHIVCTSSQEIAIIITVYEPKPPKWPTPFERRNQE